MQVQFKSGIGLAEQVPLELPRTPADRETILLVEGQPEIRRHLASCLLNLGYRVLPASHSSAAVTALKQFRGRIDLLLTDFSIPGMSGTELSRLAMADRPEIKVLYLSAYPEELVWESEFLRQKSSWLAKPCTAQMLAAGVRKAIGKRRSVVLAFHEDREVRAFLATTLRGDGYQVLEAAALRDARRILNETFVDLMIADLARFDRHGDESVRNWRRTYPATRIVVMTGDLPALSRYAGFGVRRSRPLEPADLKARWLRGADATLPKPLSAARLLETAARILE